MINIKLNFLFFRSFLEELSKSYNDNKEREHYLVHLLATQEYEQKETYKLLFEKVIVLLD